MPLKNLGIFLGKAVALGLAAALGLYLVQPALFQPPAPEATAALADGPVSYAAAVQRAAPAVVSITTAEPQDWSSSRASGLGLGSGVILRSDGYILTNNHVIANAQAIAVTLADGRQGVARVVGRDPATDLAVLQVPFTDLPSIPLAPTQPVRVGDVVMAIGNPYGIGQTVTMGIVSATGRSDLGFATYEDFIQTDAAINYGNSGGALINARGELVGVNSAFFSKGGENRGISFAIPTDQAMAVLEAILRDGRVVRGWLGLTGQDLQLTPRWAELNGLSSLAGVTITDVDSRGPAAKAGLQPGDILLQIDGQPISGRLEAMRLIAQAKPASQVSLQLIRRGKPLGVQVRIAEKPAEEPVQG